jgi:hypothetical protein
VLSFLCSIPCCFVPGAGLLGILFGALAVSFIAGARGRLSGRGLAIAGIILGIISTALWAYVTVGGVQAYTFWMKKMSPAASGIVVAAAEGKPAEARAFMTAGAQAEVDDARLAQFAAAIVAVHGSVQGPSGDFGMLIESFQKTFGNAGPSTPSGGARGQQTVPFAFETSSGPVLGWATFDAAALQSQKAEVEDLFVFIDGSSGVTLRKDGPSVGVAATMGAKVVELEDAAKQQRSAPPPAAPPSSPPPAEAPRP